MWHSILLLFNNEERSSMHTANNDRDNIPPCRTPLEIVKYGDISAPHLIHSSLSARILHRAPPPPRLQVDQNFLTQKIVADPKMRCHQKSFGIWRVTEAILSQKTCFFSKNIF